MVLDDSQSIRDAYAGQLWPDEQIEAFANIERMFPGRIVRRGPRIRPLPDAEHALREFSFQSAGATFDLYDLVSRNRIVGLLVLKDGRRVLEHYDFGITKETRWMSMSMAKSISSTLVGAAIRDGYIGGLDDLLTNYIPELKSGAYGDVSIRHLLQMASGVQWNESHTDPASERRQVLELQLEQRPGSILQFMSSLPKVAPSGQRWNYSTGETHIVGSLLHASTGRWLADYLSERIWSKIGAEADASWWLEAPDGLEIAGSGISATLRDYARFGQFVLEEGIVGDERVLPDGWVAQAGAAQSVGGETIPYGYMWWTVPSATGDGRSNGCSARGIFGQRIYINPSQKIVIAMLSARSKPMNGHAIDDNDFFNAICAAL